LPSFGEYLKKREDLIAEEKKTVTVEALEKGIVSREVSQPSKEIPSVQDIVGRSISKIGTYNDLNNRQQVVAIIDEVI
jgi:dihydropyrimidine dehydrogenase (NADP+)